MLATTRYVQIALAGLALLLIAAGCSDGESEEPNEVTVTGFEFSFDVAEGELVPGVNTISFRNDGAFDHHLQLFRLPAGMTSADVATAFADPEAPLPPGLLPVGGVGVVSSGVEASVTLDLREGDYTLICFVAEADGVPHFAQGMISSVTVEGTEVAREAPEESLTIVGRDYSLEVPETLSAGELTFRFTNAGQDLHEAVFVRLPDGSDVTDEELVAIFEGGEDAPELPGPPRGLGGVQAIIPGASQIGTVNLEAGSYALVCGIPNDEGIPHLALGMISRVQVE